MQTLWQDVRIAVRILRKNPGFTAVAVLTLAIGIGANTAIFSVVYCVLLKPLPYPGADRLIAITQADRPGGEKSLSCSFPKFTLINEQSRTLKSKAAYYSLTLSLATEREPVAVRGARISQDFFRVLGISPVLGRSFLPDEEQTGGADVAVLSDGFWRSHFGGDKNILGKLLTLDGMNTTIIGILPPNFQFPFEFPEPEVWLPRVFEHPLLKPVQVQIGAGYLSVIARLRAGATLAQADSELSAINARYILRYE
jgi:putative ABC transport system permease protein